MTSAFKEINEFLAQQEKLLLAQHAEMMLDIARGRDKHVVRLFRRVAFLDSILEEMEKCHRTPNELLKVRLWQNWQGLFSLGWAGTKLSIHFTTDSLIATLRFHSLLKTVSLCNSQALLGAS